MNKQTLKWQQPEGEPYQFYPLYHPDPDLLSSNSFIFRFPECIVVIDPGGTAGHYEELVSVLNDHPDSIHSPLFVFISHCHFDHVRSLHFPSIELNHSCHIGGHGVAVEILKRADLEHTISFLYTREIPPLKLDFALFSSEEHSAPLELGSSSGRQQDIQLPGKIKLTAYSTPGHSPCSVTYRLGSLLFTGDLLFAHNVGVAGTFGWDQAELASSLEFIKNLIISEAISQVYCGHGRVLPPEKAIRIIDSILKHLPSLKDLARLDNERYHYLKSATLIFMKEIEQQIVSQNGRLFRIARQLEELGETTLAQRVADLSLHDQLDELLQSFHHFLTEYDQGMMQFDVPVRGAALMKLFQDLFASFQVPGPLIQNYLDRLQTLFKLCLSLIRGVDFSLFSEPANLNSIITRLMELYAPHTLPAPELFDLAESEEDFGLYLARRIDGHSRKGSVSFKACTSPVCLASNEHLKALLGDVLESMLSGAAREIEVSIFCNDQGETGCRFSSSPAFMMSPHKEQFYQLFASLLGGQFIQNHETGFTFSFQSA